MEFRKDDPLVWQRRNGCPETYYSYDFFREMLQLKRFDNVCGGLQRFTETCCCDLGAERRRKTGIRNGALPAAVHERQGEQAHHGAARGRRLVVIRPAATSRARWRRAGSGTRRNTRQSNGGGTHAAPRPLPGPRVVARPTRSGRCKLRGPSEWLDVESEGDLEARAAALLARGEVVARSKGRMEFGARSLGNRAILADPAKPEVIRVINEMIKSRDFWMPFAPSMLAEREADYIVNPKRVQAPYMIVCFDTTERVADLPAAIHPYDRTARPQLVTREWNPGYHHLISEFQKITGRGVILNTSFNLHGFPIANTPEDALGVLKHSGLNHLLLGHFLVHKRPGAEGPAA